MSSTRKAKDSTVFRQERFSSSPGLERGLLANLVAQRCQVLDQAEDRELIWFLQAESHRPGGLARVAGELLARYGDRVATAAMQRLKLKPGQVCNAETVRAVRSDFPNPDDFQGELSVVEAISLPRMPEPFPYESYDDEEYRKRFDAWFRDVAGKAPPRPGSYPVQVFFDLCRDAAAEELERDLAQLCLDPDCYLNWHLNEAGPWYFPGLLGALRDYFGAVIQERRERLVVTELGRQLWDTLDYALAEGCMVLIDGLARTGKTFAAKAWCDLHPGRARYVQLSSTSDEKGFFATIARSLGVSVNLNSKAQELRQRVEETLQKSKLLLVIDEAHYLWPNRIDSRTLPARTNWLMTALVNYAVPVALITTPQFLRMQGAIEVQTLWTAEQFTGRIGHYQKLPDKVPPGDLEAVARALLPGADKQTIKALVLYAQASVKYLAGIDSAAKRARFLAARDGRENVAFSDVRRAISENVIPSDRALAQALAGATSRTAGKRPVRGMRTIAPAAERWSDSPVDDELELPVGRRGTVPAPAQAPKDAGEPAGVVG